MGANFNVYSFDASLGKKEIAKQWRRMCEQSLHDSGHSYSGCIGMLHGDIQWSDKQKPNREKAYDFMLDAHEKWDPAMAVLYLKDGKKHWLIGGWCSS